MPFMLIFRHTCLGVVYTFTFYHLSLLGPPIWIYNLTGGNRDRESHIFFGNIAHLTCICIEHMHLVVGQHTGSFHSWSSWTMILPVIWLVESHGFRLPDFTNRINPLNGEIWWFQSGNLNHVHLCRPWIPLNSCVAICSWIWCWRQRKSVGWQVGRPSQCWV